MSPAAASHLDSACSERDRSAASTLLALMSSEEPPQPEVETSDDQHNSKDGPSRKGQPWTEEEHLAFLQGLRKFGRGNWRAIAKSFVPSRTPTQVASHAQKHFMRIAGATKRKSRFTALEMEAGAPTAAFQCRDTEQRPRIAQQQQGPGQHAAVHGAPSAVPAMPFPFMHPMMFAFPGPMFPPVMCPPPVFAAAALNAMQKQGGMPMIMPPMFPMAAAMMAMNPFVMAQQMAAAAQAAMNAATVARGATSGGGTTAATGPTASNDTASSDEIMQQNPSAAALGSPLGSPTICKPEAQHARPVATGPTSSSGATTGRPVLPCRTGARSSSEGGASGVSGDGASPNWPHAASGALTTEQVSSQAIASAPAQPSDAIGWFHMSSHSAFRPPQEMKTEK